MSCTGLMDFFPANFMLQTPHHHHRGGDEDHDQQLHHHPPTSLNPIIPSCSPQDFHGVGSYMGGKRTMSFLGMEMCHEETNNVGDMDDELSDDGSQGGEKKRRLNMEQVKTLEKSFELGNKLQPERKMQLARALGLQPRQIAIWFQNRRARWKTKQLEKDYDLLKSQFEAIKADNDALQAQNQKLRAEIKALKGREPAESINLNKETEGSCSNRSENSSDNIKLDISRTPPAIDSPISDNPPKRALFPSSINRLSTSSIAQLFHNSSSSSSRHDNHLPCLKNDTDQTVANKDETLCNMFCDDQPGFWPWLEQQHFNG